MQTSSPNTLPPSFPYFPCLLLSLVFHLTLLLGVHQITLLDSSAEDKKEELISFVDLEPTPPLSREQQENVPEIAPEPEPAVPQKLTSVHPPDTPADSALGLTEGSGPMTETSEGLSDLPATPPEMAPVRDETVSETPQALSDVPISTPEPIPVSTDTLSEPSDSEPGEGSSDESFPSSNSESVPEEIGQEAGNPEATPPSEAAEPVNTSGSTPGKPSTDTMENTGEGENLEETPPLSSARMTGNQQEIFPPQKPTKEKVKRVGLLGLLGKNLGEGNLNLKPGRPLSRNKSATRGQNNIQPSNEQEDRSRSRNKGERIARLRSKALQEEQSRLTQRGRPRSGQSSGLKVIQGSDRNYGIISSSVEVKRSQLKIVYNNTLRNSPNLEGNVILEFVVSAAGTVLKCSILTSSLGSPSFEEALIKEILQWRFPKVEKGTTTILFPISFFPTG